MQPPAERPIGDTVPLLRSCPKKKIVGVLTQVDCLAHGARLVIKTKNGQTNPLLLPETASAPLQLTCGAQKVFSGGFPLTYTVNADDVHHTMGDITDIAWQ